MRWLKFRKVLPEFFAKVAEMKELAAKVKVFEAVAKEADDEFKEAFYDGSEYSS